MTKKLYPGGFRLTLAKARALAVQEFGTARGLEQEPGMPEGYFHIALGSLDVRIRPDGTDSSHRSSSRLILMQIDMDGGPERIARFFHPETLEQCTGEEKIYREAHRREALEEWIEREGPERCHKYVDQVWRMKCGD